MKAHPHPIAQVYSCSIVAPIAQITKRTAQIVANISIISLLKFHLTIKLSGGQQFARPSQATGYAIADSSFSCI